MKKLVLLLFAFAPFVMLEAQTDTIRYQDSWYEFNPMPDTMRVINSGSARIGCLTIRYPMMDNMEVVGIAITVDTMHLYIPSDSGTSCFHVHILKKLGMNPAHPTETMFQEVQSLGFSNCHKQCLFDYVGTAVNCYEFYFDTAVAITEKDYGDSLFIGFSFLWENAWFTPKNHYGIYEGEGDDHIYWGYNWTLMHNNYFHSSQSTTQPYRNIWGLIFPILRYRCTPPREFALADSTDSSRVFSWQPHDDAELYQFSYVAAGDDPEEGLLDTLSGVSYTLDSILLDSTYEVRVRKGCRFTTAIIDTLVWSEWSEAYSHTRIDTAGGDAPGEDPVTLVEDISEGSIRVGIDPNPAEECVMVTSPLGLVRIEAYNSEGRRVLDRATEGVEATIDVKAWPAGTYLLRVTTPLGTTTKKLLVK